MPAEIYTHGKQQLEAPVKRSLISSLESAYRNAWYNEDYLRNFHFNGEYLRGLETCLVRITSACLNRNILLVSSLKSVTVLNRNNHVFARNIIRPPLIRVSPQIRGGSNFSRTVDRANVSRIHTSREFHAIGDTSIQKKKKIYKKKFSRVSDFSFPRFFLPNLFLSCFGKKLKHPSRLKTTPFNPFQHDFLATGRTRIEGNLSAERETLLHRLFILDTWLKSDDRSEGREKREVRERALLPRWKFIHLERDRGTRYESGRGIRSRDLSRFASSSRFANRTPPPPLLMIRHPRKRFYPRISSPLDYRIPDLKRHRV